MIKMLQEDWQKEYNFAGNFQSALMRTIELADRGNLSKLNLGFPDFVKDYCKFAGIAYEEVNR